MSVNLPIIVCAVGKQIREWFMPPWLDEVEIKFEVEVADSELQVNWKA